MFFTLYRFTGGHVAEAERPSSIYDHHSTWSCSWVELRFIPIHTQMCPQFQTSLLFGKRSYIREAMKIFWWHMKSIKKISVSVVPWVNWYWILLFDYSRAELMNHLSGTQIFITKKKTIFPSLGAFRTGFFRFQGHICCRSWTLVLSPLKWGLNPGAVEHQYAARRWLSLREVLGFQSVLI